MSDEAESTRNEIGEAILATDASLVLWDQASTITLPEGVILTLFHNMPLHNIEGELVGGTKKPIAYYMLSGVDLIGTAELLARQAVAWAGQFGKDGLQSEVENALATAIEEGKTWAEAASQEATEGGDADGAP